MSGSSPLITSLEWGRIEVVGGLGALIQSTR